jgi:hypothetical protein
MTAKANTIRQQAVAIAPRVRSAVTNGKRLHVKRPGDTAWARRFRDVLFEICNDIAPPETLSEAQKQLARRCATIAIACERMECRAAAGDEINLDKYGMLTDRLGRTLHRLGIKRQTRDVTPLDPLDYARRFDAEALSEHSESIADEAAS